LFVASFVLIRLAGGGTNIGAMLAMKREGSILKVLLVTGAANVLLDFVLIPMIGMNGALIASTVANVGAGLALTYVMYQITGVGPPVKYYGRLLLATSAGLPALVVGSHYGLRLAAIGVLVYVTVFAVMSHLLGIIPSGVSDLAPRRRRLLSPKVVGACEQK
jgi:O-antigen/teichoic acid export membrane protein